jgi:hypothetical protein
MPVLKGVKQRGTISDNSERGTIAAPDCHLLVRLACDSPRAPRRCTAVDR